MTAGHNAVGSGVRPVVSAGAAAGAVQAAAGGAAPLYLLLATDIGNGCFAWATGQPATAAALAVKAAVALSLMLRVTWTGALLLAALVSLFCGTAYLATRGDALLPSSLEANLLLLKTLGSTVLLALVAARVRDLPEAAVARYLRTVLAVIAASLLLGLAGVGHDRYGDEDAFLAANGFLPAGNELNLALLALFWWLSQRLAGGRATWIDKALHGLCLLMMLVSGSKTTMAGALLIALWVRRKRAGALLLVLTLAFVALQVLVLTGAWDRWTWFFGVHLNEGLLSALTSGRFARAADALAAWGSLPPQGLPFMAGNGYVESDPLDLVLNFGWAGIVVYLAFAAVLWRAAAGQLLVTVLVLAASVLAGHVVYSVFAAPVLACALARPAAPVRWRLVRVWRRVAQQDPALPSSGPAQQAPGIGRV